MVGSFLSPKWPIMVPFCGVDHQKSNFSLISDTLSVGGCWGQPMLLFWKVADETQMGNPHDYAARDISWKLSIFLPFRAIWKKPYHYETPCKKIKMPWPLLYLFTVEVEQTFKEGHLKKWEMRLWSFKFGILYREVSYTILTWGRGFKSSPKLP